MTEDWQHWNWMYTTGTTTVVNSVITDWYRPSDATWTAWNYNRLGMGKQIIVNNMVVVNNPVPIYSQDDATWHNSVTHSTWTNWSSIGIQTHAIGWEAWNTYLEETQEQAQARIAQQEILEIQHRERMERYADERRRTQAERDAAEKRARELLLFHLDPQQRADLTERGYFEVISNTGKRWRIRDSSIGGNVDLMPDDPSDNRRLASYCAHPPVTHTDMLPASDHHMAQKLTLETDEEQFLRVANVHFLDRERAIRRPAA